ncbi:MAG: cyclophilin-like fold protein [Candidatus Caldatribacteriaceae bacterium]
MGQKIRFLFPQSSIEVEAELKESELGKKIVALLPLEARVNTWGQEIYFPIPLRSDIIFPQELVKKGDIGYWPDGACLCLFFGPTPVSVNSEEIRPASDVEVVGQILGDVAVLEQISPGNVVKIVKD